MKLKMIWLSLFCVMFSAEAMKLKKMFCAAQKILQGQVRKHSIKKILMTFNFDTQGKAQKNFEGEESLKTLFMKSSLGEQRTFLEELEDFNLLYENNLLYYSNLSNYAEFRMIYEDGLGKLLKIDNFSAQALQKVFCQSRDYFNHDAKKKHISPYESIKVITEKGTCSFLGATPAIRKRWKKSNSERSCVVMDFHYEQGT